MPVVSPSLVKSAKIPMKPVAVCVNDYIVNRWTPQHGKFRITYSNYHRRKFRSETSDNMGQLKSRGEKSQKRKDQKKEDAGARKGRNVVKHCVFPMIWGSGGSKSRLAKAAGAEPASWPDER